MRAKEIELGFDDTRREVAIGTRMLTQFGLSAGVRASLGHVSVRVPEDPTRFVVKGRGYQMDTLERMRPDDQVVCDLDANLIEGPANIVPCFEVKIHSCIYKARPDVQSVVHVHPKFTTVLSVMGAQIRSMANEGNRLVMDPLPVYPKQKIIVTDAEGTEVARLLGAGKAELLYGHGAVTAGDSMEHSVTDMIQLEHQAEMTYYAYAMAGPNHGYVTREQVIEFGTGNQWDLPHFKQAREHSGPTQFGGLWRAWHDEAAGQL